MGIFHVLNRGVDKRKIFLDDKDHLRFIHNLFEFNDKKPALNMGYLFQKQSIDLRGQYMEKRTGKRELLVKILAFCLMPNHYHLLLEPVVENGVTKFMRKLNVGYAKYFNTKYERKGALFEGRYKSLIVDNEAYFVHLPYYIHLNPLDLIGSGWRQRKINDHQKAENFLEQYRWSSYLDYIGKKNFPSVTQRETLNEFFGGPEQYKKETVKWLKEINLKEIDKIILE